MEEETRNIVKKTVSALESAILDSEKSGSPGSEEEKIERYRDLHLLLTEWVQDFEGRAEDEGYPERLERIRQFIDICKAFGE